MFILIIIHYNLNSTTGGLTVKTAQQHLTRLKNKGWKVTLKTNGKYKLINTASGWQGTFTEKELVKYGHKLGN